MKFKTWEKWYWGVVFTIFFGLTIWLILREKGFEATVSSQKETLSKTKSFFLCILLPMFMPLWIWFLLKFILPFFLRTDDFICKYCHKKFGKSFETRKNVCQDCYEKKKKKTRTLIKENWNDN